MCTPTEIQRKRIQILKAQLKHIQVRYAKPIPEPSSSAPLTALAKLHVSTNTWSNSLVTAAWGTVKCFLWMRLAHFCGCHRYTQGTAATGVDA